MDDKKKVQILIIFVVYLTLFNMLIWFKFGMVDRNIDDLNKFASVSNKIDQQHNDAIIKQIQRMDNLHYGEDNG